MNPYIVLGVSESSTREEIKTAYRKLVKKYHPDRFLDEFEKKTATERLAEINEAYTIIEKGESRVLTAHNVHRETTQREYRAWKTTDATDLLTQARRALTLNELGMAQSMLNSVRFHSAEWNYLQGVIYLRQGYYDSARRHFRIAVTVDPSNKEYAMAYENIEARAKGYFGSNPYFKSSWINAGDCYITGSCCASIATLCCTSCICSMSNNLSNFLRC